ncbi:MAG: hypothetical protein ACTSWG_08650 [Candidatus Helarchaeota archaeon]
MKITLTGLLSIQSIVFYVTRKTYNDVGISKRRYKSDYPPLFFVIH